MRVKFWEAEDLVMDKLKLNEHEHEHIEKESTPMKIYVNIAYKTAKFILLESKSSDTILSIKKMIQEKEGISLNNQFLYYNGVLLENNEKTMSMYDVKNMSTFHAVICPEMFDSTLDGIRTTIMIPRWDAIDMQMKPWFTPREIKAFIASSTGLQLDNFMVMHDGKRVEDSITMTMAGVTDKESIVYMLPPPPIMEQFSKESDKFQIFVCNLDREESFLVSKSNTVLEMKKMIENFATVHPDQQLLFHGSKNVTKLDDDEKTLGFYNVNEKSTVWLFTPSLKFSIKMPQVVGTTNMLTIKAYSFNSISDIKQKVFETMGIPHSSQILFHVGKFLDDAETLEAHKIERNSVVYAIFGLDEDQSEELILTILMPNKKRHKIKVKQWYSISDVKAIIESAHDMPISIQDLFYDNAKLKDWKTVLDYGIKNRSTVVMSVRSSPMQLFIYRQKKGEKNASDADAIMIEAKDSDTVRTIMDMIPEEEVNSMEGKPCLFLEDTMLVSNKMLAHYGIKSGCRLCLERLIQVNVIVPNGTSIKVELKASYRIITVKEKIEENCGIPVEVQRLTYLGDELDDYLDLDHYEKLLGSLWILRWNSVGRTWSFFWPSYVGV